MIPKKFEKKDKKPPFKKDILLSLANIVIVQIVSFVTGFIVMILAEFYSSEIFSLIEDIYMDIKHNLPEFLLLSLIVSILSIPFISLSIRFYINKYVLK